MSGIPLFEKNSKKHDEKKDDMINLSFKAVLCMIYHATEIICISLTSLYGFIFSVKSSKTYFKKLNTTGEEVDVDELLLKFAYMSDNNFFTRYFFREKKSILGKDIYIPHLDKEKSTETPTAMYNEAITQQKIYNETFDTGFRVCGSILDITFLKNKAKIQTFINLFLLHKEKFGSNTKKIMDFFYETEGELCVVTGEFLDDCITLYSFLSYYSVENNNIELKQMENIQAYICSLLLSLYVHTGIIHIDLHAGNVMIHYKAYEIPNLHLFTF